MIKKTHENKTLDKFLAFIEKDILPIIKKDFQWLGKAINRDLLKLAGKKYKKKMNK